MELKLSLLDIVVKHSRLGQCNLRLVFLGDVRKKDPFPDTLIRRCVMDIEYQVAESLFEHTGSDCTGNRFQCNFIPEKA